MRRYGKSFREFNAPLQGGFDLDNPIRKPGGFPEAESLVADPSRPRPARRKQSRDRLVQQAGMGSGEWDTDEPAQRDVSPARVQRVDDGVPGSSVAGAAARRTLLQGFTLPLPPSDNSTHDVRIVKAKKPLPNGKPHYIAIKYTTHEYEAYKKHIKDLLLEAQALFHTEHTVELCVLVSFRDARKQDIANRVKGLQDALKAALFEDDDLITTLEVRKGPTIKTGMVKITCREILFDPLENLRWINGR